MKAHPQKSNAKKIRKPKPKQAKKITPGKILRYSFLILLLSFIVAVGYHYRNGFLYYLGFKTNKRIETLTKEERKIADLRIYEIVSRHKDKVFGFDISQYQGKIDWDKVHGENEHYAMKFVFIRSTAGKNKTDSQYKTNWKQAGKKGFIRGAYHYYRPNENSIKQAENFISTVKLEKGDLPPVLDIEKIPSKQSMDSLKVGLKRWLDKVEGHYGVKPIIYSGESFYTDFLKKEFEGYTVWIANYSFFEDEIRKEWHFWQFTDKAAIEGIDGNVDVNIYNGNYDELKNHTLELRQ
ncbi:glycoside hydrolase family 25 protein [Flavobacterium beibuense]|uniref:Putative glycosylhydrolase n=1 Tax=Flavobacterium beibuense TaxID=657326 RepID=A0A444WII4_9FLAO|nr:glycoside hydrolase family 25 protein [Flavobacterium beibuense]RYJ45605.1 putative glycosylhydrolase [Flavobacterium beibuense]